MWVGLIQSVEGQNRTKKLTFPQIREVYLPDCLWTTTSPFFPFFRLKLIHPFFRSQSCWLLNKNYAMSSLGSRLPGYGRIYWYSLQYSFTFSTCLKIFKIKIGENVLKSGSIRKQFKEGSYEDPLDYFTSLFLNLPSFPFFLSESTLFNMRFKLFYFIDILILENPMDGGAW